MKQTAGSLIIAAALAILFIASLIFPNSIQAATSIKDFGAVGDGVTDDTIAFSSALNSCESDIFIPKGTYKITNIINITAGGTAKRISGENGTVLLITLPANMWKYRPFIRCNTKVEFANITFDFNYGHCHLGILYEENLGTISLKNLKFRNVDNDLAGEGCVMLYIPSLGNIANLEGLIFDNIKSLGNGKIGDWDGTVECILIMKLRSVEAPINALIRNIHVSNVHTVNASGDVVFEDAAGIHLESKDNNSKIFIEDVWGNNFGKRLIKTICNNVDMDNIYGYCDTGDALSVVGCLSFDGNNPNHNINIVDIKARGTISNAVAIDTKDTLIKNADIDTIVSSLPGNIKTAIGVFIYQDNIILDGFNITSRYPVCYGKICDGVIHNITIKNGKMILPLTGIGTSGANGFYNCQTKKGFKGFTIENVDFYSYINVWDDRFFECPDYTNSGTSIGQNLTIKNCSLYYNTKGNVVPIRLVGCQDVNIEDVNITTNTGSIYKAVSLTNCLNTNLTNLTNINT